jgi:ADP-ribosylglycohydrolase
MLGAICGDVIGSVREWGAACSEDFEILGPRVFATDDSVLTVAVADALLNGLPYAENLRRWGRAFPGRGYGERFGDWLHDESMGPYGSYGNGSAMRVSPAGWVHDTLEASIAEGRATAMPTHDHAEGVRGAEAVAGAIFVARTGGSRDDLRALFEQRFGYNVSRTMDEIRAVHTMNETCRHTVQIAAVCALGADSVEHAIRRAAALGGDADTLACIAGSIAEAMFGGVPRDLAARVLVRVDEPLREVTLRFMERYGVPLA